MPPRPRPSDRRRALLLGATFLLAVAILVVVMQPSGAPPPEESSPARQAQIPSSLTLPDVNETPVAPGEVSVRTLVAEMTDLRALARWPEPPYTTRLSSSFDRRSRDPADGEGWFANDDWVSETRQNLERVEERDGRREHVLIDAKGPGAVVRIWSATPTGTLRIYVDGAAEPVLSAPMRALLGGEIAPFTSPFAYVSARGYNLQFPFPYRERCVVTVDSIETPDPEPGKFYFQIGVRTYAGGDVRSVTTRELALALPAMKKARDELDAPHARTSGGAKETALGPAVLPPGGSLDATIDGGGGAEIRELVLRASPANDETLRAATLTLAFDGEKTVQVPLGDFFGSGPGLRSFTTLPLSTSDDRMTSRWVMPFRKSARITVRNGGAAQVTISGSARVEKAAWDDRTMLFHASWKPMERVGTRPFRDMTLSRIDGRGVYVGTVLEIDNSPRTYWWGEGDEKIRVDGETFPSWFGTGTEDYFGYAWSTPEIFWRPFHAQTRADGPRFDGRFSMNRFHVLDAIPFQRSLRFDLEIWHWSTTTLGVESVAYFYAFPAQEEKRR